MFVIAFVLPQSNLASMC